MKKVNNNLNDMLINGAKWIPDEKMSVREIIAKSEEEIPRCIWTEEKTTTAKCNYHFHWNYQDVYKDQPVTIYQLKDSNGNIMKEIYDENNDGIIDRKVEDGVETIYKKMESGKFKSSSLRYSYDKEKNVTTRKIVRDTDGDGQPDNISTAIFYNNEVGFEVERITKDLNGTRSESIKDNSEK